MKIVKSFTFVFLITFTGLAQAAFNTRGPENAPVTVVMFGDFQCPYTQRAVQNLAELNKQIPDDFKVVFRNFPLDFHENAMPAAKAVVCAGEQGKFWEMHDFFFGLEYGEMAKINMQDAAKEVGLEMTSFTTCLDSRTTEEKVRQDMQEAQLLGLKGTPYIVLVGPGGLKAVPGAYPVNEMKSFIEEIKK